MVVNCSTPHRPTPPRSTARWRRSSSGRRAYFDEPLTVEDLAAHAGCSARTLARRFTEQLGTSPGRWLLAQRVIAARELLESSELPVETVARRVGLSSATNLRRRFLDALGTTPGAYRRTFRAGPG